MVGEFKLESKLLAINLEQMKNILLTSANYKVLHPHFITIVILEVLYIPW